MDRELQLISDQRAKKENDILSREIERYDDSAPMGQAYGLGLRTQDTAASIGDIEADLKFNLQNQPRRNTTLVPSSLSQAGRNQVFDREPRYGNGNRADADNYMNPLFGYSEGEQKKIRV